MIMLGPLFDYLQGKHGLGPQLHVALQYTFTTMAGSIAAHYWALRTEKGKSAVGASKLYAQIPVAQWEAVKTLIIASESDAVECIATKYDQIFEAIQILKGTKPNGN